MKITSRRAWAEMRRGSWKGSQRRQPELQHACTARSGRGDPKLGALQRRLSASAWKHGPATVPDFRSTNPTIVCRCRHCEHLDSAEDVHLAREALSCQLAQRRHAVQQPDLRRESPPRFSEWMLSSGS